MDKKFLECATPVFSLLQFATNAVWASIGGTDGHRYRAEFTTLEPILR